MDERELDDGDFDYVDVRICCFTPYPLHDVAVKCVRTYADTTGCSKTRWDSIGDEPGA